MTTHSTTLGGNIRTAWSSYVCINYPYIPVLHSSSVSSYYIRFTTFVFVGPRFYFPAQIGGGLKLSRAFWATSCGSQVLSPLPPPVLAFIRYSCMPAPIETSRTFFAKALRFFFRPKAKPSWSNPEEFVPKNVFIGAAEICAAEQLNPQKGVQNAGMHHRNPWRLFLCTQGLALFRPTLAKPSQSNSKL